MSSSCASIQRVDGSVRPQEPWEAKTKVRLCLQHLCCLVYTIHLILLVVWFCLTQVQVKPNCKVRRDCVGWEKEQALSLRDRWHGNRTHLLSRLSLCTSFTLHREKGIDGIEWKLADS